MTTNFVTVSAMSLKAAGYEVTPADGVPGLWNVDGLARDVTTNQLHDLARRFGGNLFTPNIQIKSDP